MVIFSGPMRMSLRGGRRHEPHSCDDDQVSSDGTSPRTGPDESGDNWLGPAPGGLRLGDEPG
jgi:hypothetical protein